MAIKKKKEKKAPGEIKVEIAKLSSAEKPKTVQVKVGLTVAECVAAAGFKIDATDPKQTPEAMGLRLNSKRCKWTDKVTKEDSYIHFVPKYDGGQHA